MAKKSKSFWDRFKDSVVSLGDESAGPSRRKAKPKKKAAAKKRSASKSKAKKRTGKRKKR